MNVEGSGAELMQLLAEIEQSARESVGVDDYESTLFQLLVLLQSDDLARGVAVQQLARLTEEWPWGAVEALEFTMHRLRWPEIREALLKHRQYGTDFRTRDLAAQVLEAFEDDWPGGEIYRTYRRGRD